MLVSGKQSIHLENLWLPSVPGEEEGSTWEELKKTSAPHQSLEKKRAAHGRSWRKPLPRSTREELKKTSAPRQSLEKKRAAHGRSWRKPLTIVSPWRRRGQQMGGAEENMWPPSASFEEGSRRSILERDRFKETKEEKRREKRTVITHRSLRLPQKVELMPQPAALFCNFVCTAFDCSAGTCMLKGMCVLPQLASAHVCTSVCCMYLNWTALCTDRLR